MLTSTKTGSGKAKAELGESMMENAARSEEWVPIGMSHRWNDGGVDRFFCFKRQGKCTDFMVGEAKFSKHATRKPRMTRKQLSDDWIEDSIKKDITDAKLKRAFLESLDKGNLEKRLYHSYIKDGTASVRAIGIKK